ncbi:MAG: Gfo/Idh/MocA family oxidoreductase [Planctomycetia bacterium]
MKKISRRDALKAGSVLAAGYWLGTTPKAKAASANDKLNIACIGIGGRGAANIKELQGENLVALCDVDKKRGFKMFKKFPLARRFTDYRKMFDWMDKEIDAVVISTPDHTHFHPARETILRNKACYCEKPLGHSVWECRELTRLAKEKNVPTQLGNQRHAFKEMRRTIEAVQSGVIGPIEEVICVIGGKRGMLDKPTKFPPIPKTLNWDLWLGPIANAKDYKYTPQLCPYKWRFWWDFGTGETGNWGCHILDIPYWALGLKYPTRVDATGPEVDPLRTPISMNVTYQFPGNDDRGPVTLKWIHSEEMTGKLKKKYGLNPKEPYNTYFVGEKGVIGAGFKEHEIKLNDGSKPPKIEKSIPNSPGFYQEFITAAKGGPRATCDFVEYTGPLAETVLLGNMAYRAGGFDWDAENLKAVGNDKADALVRSEYRKGWKVS